MKEYKFLEIEDKWQKKWPTLSCFKSKIQKAQKKFYCLTMFPYPSGTLHVGHGRNYIIGDALARYKMKKGFDVFHPMGWDAFGLPAENYAISHKVHPRDSTLKNIDSCKKQFKRWGLVYPWEHEVTTCEPSYYRWTQWLFLQFYKKGLAYRKKASVNWCPSCATVLANEQVAEGSCERCDTAIINKKLTQWFLKITDYANKLLEDLQDLKNWPDRVKAMQAHWIGKSSGISILFKGADFNAELKCFTTRPDTIYGVTYVAISAEHPVLSELKFDRSVKEFIEKMKSKVVRPEDVLDKEGIFSGYHVLNPVNGAKVPMWITNYVVMDYGTGCVMAVPAHDQRDFEFSKKYHLPLKIVIQPVKGKDCYSPSGLAMTLSEDSLLEAFVEEGIQADESPFAGKPSGEVIQLMGDELVKRAFGVKETTYKLRDWLVSRQRYWGAPIPIVYCDHCGEQPIPEKDLPVVLPMDVVFKGEGESALARHSAFSKVTCPKCKKSARRETDTMDTFVDSSWYFLRYFSAQDDTQAFDTKMVNHWWSFWKCKRVQPNFRHLDFVR
ncbi:MAG: leucine--tRNA ligase [Deltaproteobacteria bacterium]|nr:leucine--tRNA ligase [Deltaproteobacteria bacterium]